jgi:hypothetical protein
MLAMHESGSCRRNDPYAAAPAWRIDALEKRLDRVEGESARSVLRVEEEAGRRVSRAEDRVWRVDDRINDLAQTLLVRALIQIVVFAAIVLIVSAAAHHH